MEAENDQPQNSMNSREVAMDFAIGISSGVANVIALLGNSAEALCENSRKKRSNFEWENRKYSQVLAYDESARAIVQCMIHLSKELHDLSTLMLEVMEDTESGKRAHAQMEPAVSYFVDSVEKFIDDKTQYLNSLDEE